METQKDYMNYHPARQLKQRPEAPRNVYELADKQQQITAFTKGDESGLTKTLDVPDSRIPQVNNPTPPRNRFVDKMQNQLQDERTKRQQLEGADKYDRRPKVEQHVQGQPQPGGDRGQSHHGSKIAALTDEQKALAAEGHGRVICACGKVVRSCKCNFRIHDAFEVFTGEECPDCVGVKGASITKQSMKKIAGFFSYLCRGCQHPLLAPKATNEINGWMSDVVALAPDESGHHGTYDGYGRISEYTINSQDDCWHTACWEKAGEPDYEGPADNAPDQGYFFEEGVHDMPNPMGAHTEPKVTGASNFARSAMKNVQHDPRKLGRVINYDDGISGLTK